MIVDPRQVDFFRAIAENQFLPMVIDDYGIDKKDYILMLTSTIPSIYKHLKYVTFSSVTVFYALDEEAFLSNIQPSHPVEIKSYENLSSFQGEKVVIQLKANGDLHCLVDIDVDINLIRQNAICYRFTKADEIEKIFGKTSEKILRPIPDADSYFSIQTYKDLDIALEDYSSKVARLSDCVYLRSAWVNDTRLFFKPRPEHILRDSLTQFLKFRLRNVEVRPEQIVDKSHPVDIKITWTFASHLALLEIKWLGKSLQSVGSRFKQIYTRTRALEGAKQLSDYLDANRLQAPVKTTKGYLIVFDARRWGCNKSSTTITRGNGLKYLNDNIIYNPDHSRIRQDFAVPVRFFLEPVMV